MSNPELEIPVYDYNLSSTDLDAIEKTACTYLRDERQLKGVAALIVGPCSPLSNFGRTGEQQIFNSLGEEYDFRIGMKDYESSSAFVYTIDINGGTIAHVKRIVSSKKTDEIDLAANHINTGIEPIDDRINAPRGTEEYMKLEDILLRSGMEINDLGTILNVATNFTTGRAERMSSIGVSYADLSYLATFNYATEPSRRYTSAITAYLNRAARHSLSNVGAEYRLLGGKEFHLPKTTGGYDLDYEAVVIPRSETNLVLFKSLGEMASMSIVDYNL